MDGSQAVVASVNNWERTMVMDRQWERALEAAFDSSPKLQVGVNILYTPYDIPSADFRTERDKKGCGIHRES